MLWQHPTVITEGIILMAQGMKYTVISCAGAGLGEKRKQTGSIYGKFQALKDKVCTYDG